MAGFNQKTLWVVGPAGSGKATIVGCMLFKYGGIDANIMQRLEINSRDSAKRSGNVSVLGNLREWGITPGFYTPKRNHVTVLNDTSEIVDVALLVLSAESTIDFEDDLTSAMKMSKSLVVVVNKMDTVGWSEELYQKIEAAVLSISAHTPVIPISSERVGDNVVAWSSQSPWYKGWKGKDQSGNTLLEALDMAFSN